MAQQLEELRGQGSTGGQEMLFTLLFISGHVFFFCWVC